MSVCGRCLVQMVVVAASGGATLHTGPPDVESAAELDARRLIGTAHYENDKYAEAAAEFRQCIELAPESAVDRFNLALVLMRAQEYEEALQALGEAQRIDADLLAVYYVRAVILKRQSEFAEAVKDLNHIIKLDSGCRGVYYNLGVCYKFLQHYEQAVGAFVKEAELSPTDPSTQYQLITLYRRLGQVDNAERHKEIYDRVKDTVDESEKTAEALERSRYTYIIKAPRLTDDLKPRPDAEVRFVEATEAFGLPVPGTQRITFLAKPARDAPWEEKLKPEYVVPGTGNAVVPFDYDGDGRLDLYVVNASADSGETANRLYHNEGSGRLVDVTQEAGVGDSGLGCGAVFGDYDNDGDADLYVVNYGPNRLYRNRGDGTFEDVSSGSRANEPQFGVSVKFVDFDHDNDLDIYVANLHELSAPAEQTSARGALAGQSNTLLRNNGNGTFSDYTDAAGLLKGFETTKDVVFGDFDGDHDVDLFEANIYDESRFFVNARMGKFVEGGRFDPPLPANIAAVSVGDFNRDGHMDLIVSAEGGLRLYVNHGSAEFGGGPLGRPGTFSAAIAAHMIVFDYNNDGWNDLLTVGCGRLEVLAGVGPGKFRDVTENVGLASYDHSLRGATLDLAAADLDGDGDEDIVLHTSDQGPVVLRNEGGNRNNWLDVRLVGKKVNRSGYGAAVEIASGGHYQKKTYSHGSVHFGLGDLKGVDVVRVTWPNGVAQNVIRPRINETLTIEEYVKVSASCAMLYTYNGRGFELVNEILGIGPLGVPMAPGVYHQPDCTELTKIEADQLVAVDGAYELRLTEELRELTYADQMTLRVVDHPTDLEIVPNEYFSAPPFPDDKFYAIGDHRSPKSAVDDRGHDVLDLVLRSDGRFPTFAMTPYDGLAEPHSLTLDLGDLSGAEQVLLFLEGWIYWPESSTVMAIAQDPRFEIAPLKLEVRDRWGNWRTAVESVGLPTSKGLVVPVDLTGRFLCCDYHVRLSTNMCVYFDRVFVSTADQAGQCRQTELPVSVADLHYRGFSQMTRDEFGYERFDYSRVSPTGSWSPPAGMLTRYGDVTPLLGEPDDMYVIFGPGDELTMRFDASGLPELPAGWTRGFIFYANGWVKDGDLNTKFSETVEPLPFHGMGGYPHNPDEQPPRTPEIEEYHRRYNTRPAGSTVGPLVQGTPGKG